MGAQQVSTRGCEAPPIAEAVPFDNDVGVIELIEADDIDRVTDRGTYTPFPDRIEWSSVLSNGYGGR